MCLNLTAVMSVHVQYVSVFVLHFVSMPLFISLFLFVTVYLVLNLLFTYIHIQTFYLSLLLLNFLCHVLNLTSFT